MLDYKFNVGDRVITVFGETGVIVDVCNCADCAERGYFEPVWVRDEDGYRGYITITEAELGFVGFHKIGDHHFYDFDEEFVRSQILHHENELRRWKDRLDVIITTRLIEEIESGSLDY